MNERVREGIYKVDEGWGHFLREFWNYFYLIQKKLIYQNIYFLKIKIQNNKSSVPSPGSIYQLKFNNIDWARKKRVSNNYTHFNLVDSDTFVIENNFLVFCTHNTDFVKWAREREREIQRTSHEWNEFWCLIEFTLWLGHRRGSL